MYIKVSIQERNMKIKFKIKFILKTKWRPMKKYKQSLKYLGGINFHGLEYLIMHEVVFCFII